MLCSERYVYTGAHKVGGVWVWIRSGQPISSPFAIKADQVTTCAIIDNSYPGFFAYDAPCSKRASICEGSK